MKYPYFRGLEADRYSFYRVPKALIKVDLFEKMSGDAKLLYAVLLDRMNKKKNTRLGERIDIIFSTRRVFHSAGMCLLEAEGFHPCRQVGFAGI